MKQSLIIQEEWLRVLTKGMITIPKSWREEFGFKEGDVIMAKKTASRIIIEPADKPAPYRVYNQKELKQFLKDDRLAKKLADKLDKKSKT